MEDLSGENLTRLYVVNDARVVQLVPVLVYMSVLSVVGTFGNSLVFYIYYKRFKRTASSYYILVLACLDLTASVLGMPFEVIDMRYSYIFDNPPVCKIFRFVIFANVMASGLTLTVIAIDRYLKVCKPLKRHGVRMKYGLIGTLILSLFLSSPALVVFGKAETGTLELDVYGTECSIDDGMHGTAWPVLYFVILVLVFLVCIVTLVILYGMVIYVLIKRKRQMQRAVEIRLTDQSPVQENERITVRMGTNSSKPNSSSGGGNSKDKQTTPASESRMHVPQSQWKVPTERTTAIFVCISTGFLLSFLPCLIIMISRELVQSFEDYPSLATDLVVNFFVRSYYLNNVLNPFIYGFFNPSFRREVATALRSCCCCLCCRGADDQGETPLNRSLNETAVTSSSTSCV